jgi:hypothetical protein
MKIGDIRKDEMGVEREVTERDILLAKIESRNMIIAVLIYMLIEICFPPGRIGLDD